MMMGGQSCLKLAWGSVRGLDRVWGHMQSGLEWTRGGCVSWM